MFGYQTTLSVEVSNNILTNNHIIFKKMNNVNNPNSVHGIYPYRGKISSIDARQIISQLPNHGTLLDPFCGSGTIIYEAQRWGLNAFGVDVNPIACIISKAKTQNINYESIINHSMEMVSNSKLLNTTKSMPEWPKKFFHEKTAKEIMNIYSFRNEMSYYEIASFYGAIALTARACNHYEWSSNAIGKIIEPLLYVNFYDKYLYKLKKHIKFVNGGSPVNVIEHDTRNITEVIEEESIDFVFTSPPYFDALDYTSYYTKLIYEIDENFNRKNIRKKLIQDFSTYENDMKNTLSEIKKVCKKNAIIIFVVGDKKTKDNVINGGDFFSKISDWKPTYVVEREYTGTSSQIWDKINKTKRKEQIVVWFK
jgi:site-specific DNA-methyltransferase (cytosine-N4-specific)